MPFRVVKLNRPQQRMWLSRSSLRVIFLLASAFAATVDMARAEPARFWEVVLLRGDSLHCLQGRAENEVVFFRCAGEPGGTLPYAPGGCEAIPWQLDERDRSGTLVLDDGPQPNHDDPPGVIDDNDEIRFMYADASAPAPLRIESFPTRCAVEIEVGSTGKPPRFAYAAVSGAPAARSPRRYVEYDAARDVIRGRRVSLGFGGATPQYLALRAADGNDQQNLLDRLKVRVSARFLGLIPVWRDEGDLTTELVAWRAGPLRVIRRQRQWARIGWGIRSPTFGSDTYFHADYADLPVHLRLNFPPTYFFTDIEIAAVLDFVDLGGWRLLAGGMKNPVIVGAQTVAERRRLNTLAGDWFVLFGPEVTLVETLATSPSLTTLKRELAYAEQDTPQPPERSPGEQPAVGYRLSRWEQVGSGAHWFSSSSHALPTDYDLDQFMEERSHPVSVETRMIELSTDR